MPVFALMGLVGPSAQALMTRRVGPSEQGQLQGANSSIIGITGLIGPGLFTLTFASFIRVASRVAFARRAVPARRAVNGYGSGFGRAGHKPAAGSKAISGCEGSSYETTN